MLKGALLGVGNVAVGGHLPGWRSRAGVEIVAGADARPERRALLHKSFPEARWYDTAEDLLARETLDFVDICTPPWAHAALVRSALERSIHVLCEKPLILSPEELRGLPALAADKDRTLCTVHNWLHSPALAQMTERVRAGALGDVRRVAWETLRDQPAAAAGDHDNWRVDPARAGGGVLMDHGWHALYCLSAWLPGEPRRVAARLETRKHTQWKVEDTATVILAYPSGSAEIFLTWAADRRANVVEIEGTNGILRLDGGRLELRSEAAPPREWTFSPLTEGSHHPDWFVGVIEEFLAEIADPATRGRNLAQAARCMQTLALARESHRRGGAAVASDRTAGVPGAGV